MRCCAALHLFTVDMQMEIPVPPVHELNVRGAENMFTGNAAGSADVEVTLDMQVWPYMQYAEDNGRMAALQPGRRHSFA